MTADDNNLIYNIMFWRFIPEKDGKDEFGRTKEEAWEIHAKWCLLTLLENEPDNDEKMDYIFKNSPTCVACPPEFRKYLAGTAAFTAYTEIKAHFESFKKYYTENQIKWVEGWMKNKI